MSQRGVVATQEYRAATATVLGLEGNDGGALFGRDQGPGVLVVTGLTAGFAVAVPFARGRFGVGMFAGGWPGGIAGRLIEAGFELFDFCQQNSDDGLSFRRLPCDDLFRDERFV